MSSLIPGIFVFIVWAFAVYGWFANLFMAAQLFIDNAPVTALFVGRVAGIVIAPLGVVLGYL